MNKTKAPAIVKASSSDLAIPSPHKIAGTHPPLQCAQVNLPLALLTQRWAPVKLHAKQVQQGLAAADQAEAIKLHDCIIFLDVAWLLEVHDVCAREVAQPSE
jgi:hypothetical protein